MAHYDDEFPGTERFTILRRLGAGGMGIVYEAYDRDRAETVALKTLLRAEASALYLFKNEFRALADVAHPNLINLYEFLVEGDRWFFTMELIDGVHFLDYVRTSAAPVPVAPPDVASSATTARVLSQLSLDRGDLAAPTGLSSGRERDSRVGTPNGSLREDALRSALRQLGEGLVALHEKGVLHRDIKSSNVLVTGSGRVVILDFGISTERVRGATDDVDGFLGTPAYMSPEQAASQPVSEASDWYSVGVMLYHALTGRSPFVGSVKDLILNKQRFEPPPPSDLVEGVPQDLNQICQDLLRRRPEARLSGRELLERLETSSGSPSTWPRPPLAAPEAPFLGREPLLRELALAFKATTDGRTVSVYIHGASGMGKSALVRHFLDGIHADEGALVLTGRCYEKESIPYKAVDGVIDRLSRHLMSLPGESVRRLLPRDVLALSRLFPVLLQVEAVASAPRREPEIPDPLALRRRAFAALRTLLVRIGELQPLVVYIDDLQWSDADSMALIEGLLLPPDAPRLLLLASFRTEEIDAKPFLQDLLKQTGNDAHREMRVKPLTPDETVGLVQSLLGARHGNEALLEAIVRESGGSPFFVEQLAICALETETATERGTSLAEMLDVRLRRLPSGARPLLSTLAVAGRPVDSGVAYAATSLTGDERPLVAALRAARFLRSSGSAQRIELYHDRIRETLFSLLQPDARKRIHRSLAETLEAKGFDDPEALYEHYLGADERERAGTCAVLAARKAAGALAFDQAALYYRRAQDLAPIVGMDAIELKVGLGDALVNAGRPADAARAFLDVAHAVDRPRALEFQRRAAEQLLMGGHTDEGLKVIRTVLAGVGFRLPRGPKRAFVSLLIRRAHLRLRGLRFVERDVSEVAPEDLQRIDVCWAVAAGLSLSDTIRGADFQTRNLLLALRAGELYRISRAISIETGFSSIQGGPNNRRSAQLQEMAEYLAARVGHPHAIGLATMWTGVAACALGDWKKAFEFCDRALEILRDRCVGVALDMATAQRFLLYSLMNLGEMAELCRRVPMVLAAAREQGNLYLTTDLRTAMNVVWLAADDTDRAHAEVMGALREWSHQGFVLQHYCALHALTQIDLYAGRGASAWRRVSEQWPAMKRSLLLQIQTVRIEALHFRGRSALAAATAGEDVARFLTVADRMAHRIAKEKMAWSTPVAALLQAGGASLRGKTPLAARLLSDAADGFTRVDMNLYAAVARRRLGEIRADDEGRRLVADADAWMINQQIKSPRRMTRMLAPGFRSDVDGV